MQVISAQVHLRMTEPTTTVETGHLYSKNHEFGKADDREGPLGACRATIQLTTLLSTADAADAGLSS